MVEAYGCPCRSLFSIFMAVPLACIVYFWTRSGIASYYTNGLLMPSVYHIVSW